MHFTLKTYSILLSILHNFLTSRVYIHFVWVNFTWIWRTAYLWLITLILFPPPYIKISVILFIHIYTHILITSYPPIFIHTHLLVPSCLYKHVPYFPIKHVHLFVFTTKPPFYRPLPILNSPFVSTEEKQSLKEMLTDKCALTGIWTEFHTYKARWTNTRTLE